MNNGKSGHERSLEEALSQDEEGEGAPKEEDVEVSAVQQLMLKDMAWSVQVVSDMCIKSPTCREQVLACQTAMRLLWNQLTVTG